MAMVIGFLLAWRLPVRAAVLGSILLDIVLMWWIRDSLAINIVMLIYPIDAIRDWQLGR
jgi:hypothetical protein